MMKKTLTVFTPTYNRAHTLVRTYESLCAQTCKDFVWLIIDDGSTDETKKEVSSWIEKQQLFVPDESSESIEESFCGLCRNDIYIAYILKKNGGLHTGYNVAIANMNTELCTCIDSDDWMPEDGVEKIINFWKDNGSGDVAGILGLDFIDGNPIGGYFPEGVVKLKMIEMSRKYHHYGDVKVVHRTELLKQVAPMPTFDGEKNFNPIYLFYKIDENYPLLLLNENLCCVEYQQDGMSNNIFHQYVNSPRSFAELRKLFMSRIDAPWTSCFRNAIHYVSSEIMLSNRNWLKESPKRIITLLASPFGLLLFVYIKLKTRK